MILLATIIAGIIVLGGAFSFLYMEILSYRNM